MKPDKFDRNELFERREAVILMDLVTTAADKCHGGHVTIMKFTSGWKGFYGTPDLDSGKGRDEVARLPNYASLYLLLADLYHQHYHEERP